MAPSKVKQEEEETKIGISADTHFKKTKEANKEISLGTLSMLCGDNLVDFSLKENKHDSDFMRVIYDDDAELLKHTDEMFGMPSTIFENQKDVMGYDDTISLQADVYNYYSDFSNLALPETDYGQYESFDYGFPKDEDEELMKHTEQMFDMRSTMFEYQKECDYVVQYDDATALQPDVFKYYSDFNKPEADYGRYESFDYGFRAPVEGLSSQLSWCDREMDHYEELCSEIDSTLYSNYYMDYCTGLVDDSLADFSNSEIGSVYNDSLDDIPVVEDRYKPFHNFKSDIKLINEYCNIEPSEVTPATFSDSQFGTTQFDNFVYNPARVMGGM